MKMKLQAIAVTLAAAVLISISVRADTAFYNVAANSTSCYENGGTIPLQIFSKNISPGSLPGYVVNVCASVPVFGISPGSANQPPGGTSVPATCSLGNADRLSVTGNWPVNFTDSWFVGSLAPTAGQTATFQVSVSDGTHTPVSTTVGVPACAANGPVLQITKSGPDTVRRSDLITFSISVTNTGTAPTDSGWGITDTLPSTCTKSQVQYGKDEPTDCQLAASNGTATVSCPDILQPGQTESFVVICTAETVGKFHNTAIVHGGGAPNANSQTVDFQVFSDRQDPDRVFEGFVRIFTGGSVR